MQWQTLLTNGNEYFHQQCWQQAEYYYKQAYQELESQWQQELDNSELLMAWLCACNNLSVLFERLGEMQVSLQFLKYPHAVLQAIADNPGLSSDTRLVATYGMKHTLAPLLMFTEKHPTCSNCRDKLLAEQKALFKNNDPIH